MGVSVSTEKSKKEKIRELRRKALQESLEAKERKEREKRNEDAKKESDDEEVIIPNDPLPDGKVFCTICKGGPMQKKNLTTHMSHKHGGKIYECVPCDKKFTCKAYLTNHQKSSCKERFRKMR